MALEQDPAEALPPELRERLTQLMRTMPRGATVASIRPGERGSWLVNVAFGGDPKAAVFILSPENDAGGQP